MRLFEFKKSSYDVKITEEVLLLMPFKAVYSKDKSKDKDLALKEFAFIWFFTDITSPYQNIIDDEGRIEEIRRDIDLPINWKIDKTVDEAIKFYRKISRTSIQNLYDAAMIAADSVNDVFKRSKTLISESGDEIAATLKVIGALEKLPKVMQNLTEAEKQLIHQIEDKENKKIGSKSFALYEEGLTID